MENLPIPVQVLLLVAGFVLLIKGADWLIDGASSTASHFKVSKLLIGLTIVAFGTGTPELAVSISSMISGNNDMLLGNIIGSNIINILLLIGIAALIRPIRIKKDTVKKELPMLLLISIILVVLFADTLLTGDANIISRTDGLICLLFFAIFVFYIISMARKNRKQSSAKKEVEKPKFKLGVSFLLILIGLVGVVGGAELVVENASSIAHFIGIDDRIIALTIVAFGTSLPELITTITAAKRGENELLVGNIIGSNIFNICIVLGLPVAIFGGITPSGDVMIDLVVMVAAAIILWLVSRRDYKITRGEGVAMLVVFLAYYGYVIAEAIAAIGSAA